MDVGGCRLMLMDVDGFMLMIKRDTYIELENLEVYKLSRELSRNAWKIYSKMDIKLKIIIGDQFIRSADSVGANIAEGYARYHALDRCRFYYFSRASLSECVEHWLSLLKERNLISGDEHNEIYKIYKPLQIKLNNFISAARKSK